MNINTLILEGNKTLLPFKAHLQKVSKGAIEKIVKKIPIDNVDIVFYVGKDFTIKHIGIGGYTPTLHLVMIPLDPDFPGLSESITENLPKTLAHEMYHALREYSYDSNRNLLDSLINEGLADHFGIEMFGGLPEKWSIALDEKELAEFTEKSKKDWGNSAYNHRVWFFSSKKEIIPYWAGYSIGFDLVKKYFEKHPEEKPSTVYKVKAEDFVS